MSKKVEVDDAMALRFMRKYHDDRPGWAPSAEIVAECCAALEAALTEPPEEEIEVTGEMLKSGWASVDCVPIATSHYLATAFRAMERVRRKAEKHPVTTTWHRRVTDIGVGLGAYHGHRRKDDP